jgi:glutamyl-tRNA synthetase/nondiscriminating glutamyl-tRNA synthetase
VDLLAPYVDRLDQFPDRASIAFNYSAAIAISNPDNAEVFASEKTRPVIQAFAKRARSESPLTAEKFKSIMDEVKAETGAKGKDLFHPVRVVLIGSHSGPAFEKLIPLLEEGSTLNLPVHVKSGRERIAEFISVLEQG